MLDIIFILLNLLRLVLWPSMWLLLENVPHELEKNVHSFVWSCNVLLITIKSNQPTVFFETTVALLIICHLSINVNVVLKVPTVIVLLSISPFISVDISFIYLGVPVLGAYMLTNVISSSCISVTIKCPSLFFGVAFLSKSILSDVSVASPTFLSFLFA